MPLRPTLGGAASSIREIDGRGLRRRRRVRSVVHGAAQRVQRCLQGLYPLLERRLGVVQLANFSARVTDSLVRLLLRFVLQQLSSLPSLSLDTVRLSVSF